MMTYREAVDHYKRNPDIFWSKVQKTDHCWLWTGATNMGYGHLRKNDGTFMRATALAWEFLRGPVPAGMQMLHKCDTPACVNPDHLFIGTGKDNIRDCIAKGRFRFNKPRPGMLSNLAKLTDEQVTRIRAEHANGVTLSQLSRRYGVGWSCVQDVVKRKTWRHVPEIVSL